MRFSWPDFSFARLVSIACICSAAQIFAQQTFVQQHGLLSVKGNRIVDKNGNPTALHGMSMYSWNNQGTMFYNASAINHLAQDWKCTAIRIPILPGTYQGNPSGSVSQIKTVVDACIANGIYAIVDWHSMDGAQNNIQSSKNFFTAMANAYGTTPNIMYETWNEPVQEAWATVIKPYHEAIIQTIRGIDPDNIIICGSREWSQNVDEASKNPITISTNIAYTLHFYAATHKQSLRNKLDTALKHGIAIFVTEYGSCEASGSGVFDSLETRRWWNHLDSNYIGCTNWAVETNNETAAAFNSSASSTGPWTNANLTAPGMFVRNYIMSKYQAVGVLTNGFKFPGRDTRPGMNVSYMGGTWTLNVFAVSGARIAGAAGGRQASGSYVFGMPRGGNCGGNFRVTKKVTNFR